jgi:hypothetical protein
LGVITLKISDDLERKLRAKAGRLHGASKGTISLSVEEALRAWLGEGKAEYAEPRLFVARRGGAKVAEAPTLMELARRLKIADIDPRDAMIESLPTIQDTRRMGLRTRE